MTNVDRVFQIEKSHLILPNNMSSQNKALLAQSLALESIEIELKEKLGATELYIELVNFVSSPPGVAFLQSFLVLVSARTAASALTGAAKAIFDYLSHLRGNAEEISCAVHEAQLQSKLKLAVVFVGYDGQLQIVFSARGQQELSLLLAEGRGVVDSLRFVETLDSPQGNVITIDIAQKSVSYNSLEVK